MQNEAKLIRNACRGDENAFAGLYQSYHQRVYRYILSRVFDRANAEELTSQTFLAVLEGLPHYRHNGKFAAWIFSIARNKIMDHFRSMKRVSHSVDEQMEVFMVDPQLPSQVEARERMDALAALIQQLPMEHQELLRLRFVAELTYQEIGTLSGRGAGAVKKNVYRLLEELRQSLEKEHGQEA
jgi:RNA polymerase sigma-70 factor (ECF subfamily)